MSESTRQILILGSGAREHSIADAILRFDSARRVVVAPGNGGIAGAGLSSQPVDLANHAQVIALARAVGAELVIVGPEAPLCDGIVDSHYIYRQLEEVKHQYGCFFDSYLRTGTPTVVAPAPLTAPCQ